MFKGCTHVSSDYSVSGDLNSHSPSWGYEDLNRKGEEVENWMITNSLQLLNDPDDAPTYYSRQWRTTSTPDLAMATEDTERTCTREVCPQLGGSDHKPVIIHLDRKTEQPKKLPPSWYYKKANWVLFKQLADHNCSKIPLKTQSTSKNARSFSQAILDAAKQSIPRGRRHNYQPFWSKELEELHQRVSLAREEMEDNPTDQNVIAHNKVKAEYIKAKTEHVRKSWYERTESLNLEKDTTQLWNLTKTLNEEQPSRGRTVLETNDSLVSGRKAANIFATMYQERSIVSIPSERRKKIRQDTKAESSKHISEDSMVQDLTLQDLNYAIGSLQTKKAPGPDGINNDMLKQLGPATKKTLLSIFNSSWNEGVIPTAWKLAHIIPVHKKGKCKTHPES